MIDSKVFFNFLKKKKINFFAGVPDSLLKDFNSQIIKSSKKNHHFICSNEGSALSLAAGYNISSKNIPLVYLQNAGLGNLINPLVSLIDKSVYSIPMIVMIGWRGHKKINDEPQHLLQGESTTKILKVLKQKFDILSGNKNF